MDELIFYNGNFSGEEIDGLLASDVNPNLLENWYWIEGNGFPINQRGQMSYSGSDVYCIDRWRTNNAQIITTVESSNPLNAIVGGVSLQNANNYIYQKLNPALKYALNNKNVTVSVLYGGTISSNFLTGTTIYKKTSDSEVTVKEDSSISIRITTTGNIKFVARQSGSNIIRAVKLEYGTQQTLVKYDLDSAMMQFPIAPNYTEELMKCQRYLYVINGRTQDALRTLGLAMPYDSTHAAVNIKFPMPMISSPTINVDSAGGVLRPNPTGSSGSINISSVAVGNFVTNQQCTLAITAADTLTMGAPYVATMNNAAYTIVISAEL